MRNEREESRRDKNKRQKIGKIGDRNMEEIRRNRRQKK